jgi:xanthine/CO dehydrogenase XdhC/CoxF family maturation factor
MQTGYFPQISRSCKINSLSNTPDQFKAITKMTDKLYGNVSNGLGKGALFTELDWAKKQFIEKIGIDPRTSFASDERFPDVTMMTDWPDEAIRKLKPDPHTAVVTLTHDPKLDDPALKEVLPTNAFYIGSLGSKRTHASRLERLRAEGINEETLSRIHAPVGLYLGGRRPAEIALSIMAEIVQTLRLTA